MNGAWQFVTNPLVGRLSCEHEMAEINQRISSVPWIKIITKAVNEFNCIFKY